MSPHQPGEVTVSLKVCLHALCTLGVKSNGAIEWKAKEWSPVVSGKWILQSFCLLALMSYYVVWVLCMDSRQIMTIWVWYLLTILFPVWRFHFQGCLLGFESWDLSAFTQWHSHIIYECSGEYTYDTYKLYIIMCGLMYVCTCLQRHACAHTCTRAHRFTHKERGVYSISYAWLLVIW